MESNQAPGLRIAFQGERGAYSEDAILAVWGPQACPVPQPTFLAVFQAVAAGVVDAGLVPIENSHAGRIADVEALVQRRDVQVVREWWQPIRHCLLALPGQQFGDIRHVWSHPQALAQCYTFLRRQSVEQLPESDTAGSARLIREQGLAGVAAIASARAADLYQLEILASDIQTAPDNRTRFLILRRAEARVAEDHRLLSDLKEARQRGQLAQAGEIARVLEQHGQDETWGMSYGS